MLDRQMKALQVTEKLIMERAKLEIGNGDTLPELNLIEKIGDGLRLYQKIGVEWLMSIHNQGLNGILADEMGLGKTIQTISLLAYLAEYKQDWGPHLVVVPMSVLLNWDMEFKRWCPAFNVLVYHGQGKKRAQLRKGWNVDSHLLNVVLVSYNTVLADQSLFRRRHWHYLILDEAHTIKSWESQRWQVMLNFTTEHRLLLSGTPLQNNPMELWSLLHFLMPDSEIFENFDDFKSLYGSSVPNPEVVQRLHQILRPFILRRLKCDVEQQLPTKCEKIIMCPLSRRQRELYDEYMGLDETKATLSSRNALGILAILMSVRKVCNHPSLFAERPVQTPYVFSEPVSHTFLKSIHFDEIFSISSEHRCRLPSSLVWNMNAVHVAHHLTSRGTIPLFKYTQTPSQRTTVGVKDIQPYLKKWLSREKQEISERYSKCEERNANNLSSALWWNCFSFLLSAVIARAYTPLQLPSKYCPTLTQRITVMESITKTTVVTLEKCVARNADQINVGQSQQPLVLFTPVTPNTQLLHTVHSMKSISLPDKRFLKYDSGKLQVLSLLLPQLQREGHKCLIFTQFRKVLDILEEFLSSQFFRYVRLDGQTPVHLRQRMVTQFNHNPRLFAFLLSTRSGGLGLNLTGGDTVIFFDSDWNPAIDLQAQDRCHRIGQTRNVTIYRLISEHTVEERIMLRAHQKKLLNNVIIRAGGFQHVQPSSMEPTNVLDFFHDFDEDYNQGKGDPERRKQFEAMLRQVEDKEDAEPMMFGENEMEGGEGSLQDYAIAVVQQRKRAAETI
eukprot:PhF_6_TR40733/c0_g1_i1/m.61284/K11681/SWR1; helicase SWR1